MLARVAKVVRVGTSKEALPRPLDLEADTMRVLDSVEATMRHLDLVVATIPRPPALVVATLRLLEKVATTLRRLAKVAVTMTHQGLVAVTTRHPVMAAATMSHPALAAATMTRLALVAATLLAAAITQEEAITKVAAMVVPQHPMADTSDPSQVDLLNRIHLQNSLVPLTLALVMEVGRRRLRPMEVANPAGKVVSLLITGAETGVLNSCHDAL